MGDQQEPRDPAYEWLYSARRNRSGPADDETRPIRKQPAQPPSTGSPQPPRSGQQSAGSGQSAESARPGDATQVLGVQPRPTRPAGSAPAGSPDSFGGTFPTPPPGAQPKFATPTQTYPATPPPRPPLGATTPAQQRPRRKRRNWWLRGILLLLLLWLVFLLAVPIWTWKHINKVDAEPDGARPSATPGTTYLLVGSDSRAGLTKQQRGDLGTGQAAGQRTDTIVLLHVPDGGGPNLLLSVPRDSYVDIPGHGMSKINAAYALGGPKLLVRTIEHDTGVRVDDYVEVGFAGFVDVVDAVGGIQVCPTQSISDPKAGHLKMSKGCQQVDGHTALDYSRSRAFALGDITRALHQREVISAVGKKAASWQTVVLPWRYLAVNRAAADSLTIGDNVGPFDLARFAWAMAHSSGSNAKRCVVPYSSLGAATAAGSAVIWDAPKSKALFSAIRADDTSSIHCAAQ
jgi:LCP family protein required for cell wall assembly